jgi:hypothetical protein
MIEERTVVTEEEKNIIIEWVNNNHKTFIFNPLNNSVFTFVYMIKDKYNNDSVYNIIKKIESRIIAKEKLQEFNKCYKLDDLIYYMDASTKIHVHKDENEDDANNIQVRFNVCIQKPISGGIPIYAGKQIDIEECKYIVCRAGLDMHSSGVIFGDKPKISISFGFFIDKDKIGLYTNRDKIYKL